MISPLLATVNKRRVCKACGEKYAQPHSQTCRLCARAAGDLRTLFERERENVARRRAKCPMGAPIPAADLAPRPDVERTINGVTYYVVWDGA